MAKLFDLVRVTTATAGTADLVLGAAVSSFLTPAQAGVADGDTVTYTIANGAQREMGHGTYNASANTISRDTVLKSTNGNAKIALSGGSQVALTLSASDVVSAPAPGIVACQGGSGNPLSFTSANVTDDFGVWTSAQPTRITVPAGKKRIRLTGVVVGNYATFYAQVFKNGSAIANVGEPHDNGSGGGPAGTSYGKVVMSPWLVVSPGDYFELGAVNTSSTGLTYSGWLQAEFDTAAVVMGGSSGGVGASSLATLSDVALSSPANKQALCYDTASSTWKNQTVNEMPTGDTGGADTGKMLVVQPDGSVKMAPDSETPGAIPATTWRVFFNDGTGAYLSIFEIQFREVAGTPQNSTGGVVNSDGNYFSGYEPTKAFDANTSTAWGPRSGTNSWASYQHTAARQVAQVAIYAGGSGGTVNITSFTVQYYNSTLAAWVTAASFSGLTTASWTNNGWTLFTVPPAGIFGARISLGNLRDVSLTKSAANDGKVLAWNNASTSFVLAANSPTSLNAFTSFVAPTSANPALKATSTTVAFRLGDDSADAGITVAALQASAGASLLTSVRIQSGRITFGWSVNGGAMSSDCVFGWTATAGVNGGLVTPDLYLGRNGPARLRLGNVDAAAPVAQALEVQNVTGATDTAGVDFTIKGSRGTGAGEGGDVVVQVAPAGATGSSQNAFAEVVRFFKSGLMMLAGGYLNFGTTKGIGGYGIRDNGGAIEFKNNGGSWAGLGSGGGGSGNLPTGGSAGQVLRKNSGTNYDASWASPWDFKPPLASLFTTAINDGTALTLTDDPDVGLLATTVISSNVTAMFRAAAVSVTSGANFTATMKMKLSPRLTANQYSGLIVRGVGQTKFTSMRIGNARDTYIDRWASPTSYTGADFSVTNMPSTMEWMRMVYVYSTDTLTLQFSADGKIWVTFATYTATTQLGARPDVVGIAVGAVNGPWPMFGMSIPYFTLV